jgi:DNA-binding MarR family transcriptional regulator
MEERGYIGMDDFTNALNNILIEAYHNILRFEELSLQKSNKINLSISEMHLIEIVGKAVETGISISELAKGLNITRPSATVAVNKLEKKGYLRKVDCQEDGRVVRVFLTPEGRKIDSYHKYYHKNMVKEISEKFSLEEKNCLLQGIYKLNNYFKNSIGDCK